MTEIKLKYITLIIAIFCITIIGITFINSKKYHPYDINRDGRVNTVDYAVVRDYVFKNQSYDKK